MTRTFPETEFNQCNEKDLTKLCIRDLEAGETNGRMPLGENWREEGSRIGFRKL